MADIIKETHDYIEKYTFLQPFYEWKPKLFIWQYIKPLKYHTLFKPNFIFRANSYQYNIEMTNKYTGAVSNRLRVFGRKVI
jgi:tRNA1(Val) A37 N6-methylase TrmN6